MTDFEYDCLQKKRLARQAQYRKRGSKSRKCSLLTDHMTEKQWKERNGKILSVELNKPMSWSEFKALTRTLQSAYIKHLIEKYGATTSDLAEMFGVSRPSVSALVKNNGLDVVFHKGRSMPKDKRPQWVAFLTGADAPLPREPDDNGSAPEITDIFLSKPASPSMSMREFSLVFEGRIDANAVANSLISILGRNSNGLIEIRCSLS